MQQVGGASAPLAVPEDVTFVPTVGAHLSAAEAEVYGTELYRLHVVEHVPLTAANIVVRARSPKSPLHGWFTWDDKEAASLYREREARNLLAGISFVCSSDPDAEPEPIRFFAALSAGEDEEAGVSYFPMSIVRVDADLTAQLLANAARELAWFRRKYRRLKELETIVDWEALDALLNASK
jgi:hypothetical protein